LIDTLLKNVQVTILDKVKKFRLSVRNLKMKTGADGRCATY